MRKWLSITRGPAGMVLTWAVGWALLGMLIEAIQEIVPGWNGAIIDIWPTTLAVGGLLAGAIFSLMLWMGGGGRPFDELSLPRAGALGAATGVSMGWFVLALGFARPVFPSLWLRAPVVIVPMTILGLVSALGLIVVARIVNHYEPARTRLPN